MGLCTASKTKDREHVTRDKDGSVVKVRVKNSGVEEGTDVAATGTGGATGERRNVSQHKIERAPHALHTT